MTPTATVLVLGEDERAFLAVIRSFGRRGATVHCAWTSADALARRSRYVTMVHDELPRYVPEDLAWRDGLVGLCERHRFDLVIPVNDASVVPLQRHRAALEPYGRFALLPDRAFEVVNDKGRTHALARSLGVSVPRQTTVTGGGVADVDASWFPVVVKPRASFTGSAAVRQSGVVRANDPSSLTEAIQRVGGEAIVEEFVPGGGVGVEVLAFDGRVLTALQHARVHELHRDGADSYRVTEAVDPALGAAVERIIDALGYTGVGMFEFRRDPATGRWALLEINGRFWGSLPLCLKVGADFPWWLYQMLVEGRRVFPRSYPVGVACRNWSRDLTWLRQEIASREGRLALPGRVVREVGALLRGREGSDTLVRDDPAPGLEEVRRLARRGVGWVRRRVRRKVRDLAVVRDREAKRLSEALRRGGTVLVVCKGNICRSPFAERYLALRHPSAGRRVSSAGYHPKTGRPSPAAAIEAARTLGVDLGSHASRIVDESMIDAADMVLVFDHENTEVLTRRFPAVRTKLHRLAVLRSDGAAEIADPYGGDVAAFAECYRVIAAALDAATA